MCFAAAIGLCAFGVARWDWFLTELGAVFLGLMGLAAVLGGLDPNRVAREFGNGAAELTSAALIIGFARTIEVVLDDAPIKDTVIHGITGSLENLPAALSASGMLLVQSVFNFFIPSGRGQAYVTMPIKRPWRLPACTRGRGRCQPSQNPVVPMLRLREVMIIYVHSSQDNSSL